MNCTISRRKFLSATAVGATVGFPQLSSAQSFPDKSKPIRGLVPSGAGSASDVVARTFGQALGEILGASFIVENRAGADGVIGMQAAKSATPDGQTILFTSLSTVVLNPFLLKQLPYDPFKDFIPIAGTAQFGLIMFAGKSVQHGSAREFFDAARANPGKFTYASSTATTRVGMHMIAKAAGVELLNIPYKNHGDAMTNVISGKVDVLLTDMAAAQAYLAQGVRPFAAATASRIPSSPDLPTLSENGVPNINIVGWHGAWVPANTPEFATDVLKRAFGEVWTSKIVKDFCGGAGIETLNLAGERFGAYHREEAERWGTAITEAGLARSI